MHAQMTYMDDQKSAQTEHRKTEALLFPFSSSFKPSTIPPPPPDLITLGSHNIPFSDSARNLWIHSRLKTVHKEARHKKLSNRLFQA